MTKYMFFFSLLFIASIAYSQTAAISGSVNTPLGDAIPNTTITLKSANFEQVVTTNNNGIYNFANVPTEATYTLEIDRTGDLFNGVTTFDLVQMMQTILALRMFDFPAQNLAGDIDFSGTVSVRDVWTVRQIILGIENTIETPIWRFVPIDYSYPDPIMPITITLNETIENLNFIGVKAGDVNGSARF